MLTAIQHRGWIVCDQVWSRRQERIVIASIFTKEDQFEALFEFLRAKNIVCIDDLVREPTDKIFEGYIFGPGKEAFFFQRLGGYGCMVCPEPAPEYRSMRSLRLDAE